MAEKKLTKAESMAEALEVKIDADKKNTEKKPAKAEKKPSKAEKAKKSEKTKKAEKAKKNEKTSKPEKAKKADKSKKPAAKTETEGGTKKKRGGGSFKYLSGLLFAKMARGGANQLSSNAEEVNKLNVFPVPDGDTGDNMKMTIDSGIAAIENSETDNLSEVMDALSHGMLLGARGNSGVILSQFFAGMSKGLEHSDKADPTILGHAVDLGVKQAYASVMTPTEGTILTVAREASEYAASRITPKSTIKTFFADLVEEMHRSLDRTPETLLALKEAGVVDSGGAGLLYIMEGFNSILNGEEVQDTSKTKRVPMPAAFKTSFDADSVMTYGYCTELLLQLQNSKTDTEKFDVEPLKAFLSELGDSIVAFKTGSIVKLHVHTLTPEKVLAYCREYGEFLTVKIENMSVQHSDTLNEKKDETAEAENAPEVTEDAPVPDAPIIAESAKERKTYGVVSTSRGPGIEKLFIELGADVIIRGGQTHNPSTNEFLEAFDAINADHIFVFPNNGNILMAAQQAAELYDKANIIVIPSKNIGAGYVALSTLDLTKENVEELTKDALDSLGRVTSGYISPSIRNADINSVHINEGDTIGIIDKEIVISEPDRAEAARKLAEKLLDMPEKFMLTVFRGVDATPSEALELEAYITEKYPYDEIYFIDGGQDIYPYIFVAE